MSNNDRDTKFQDFAKLLWDELMMAHGGSYGYIDVSNDGLDAGLIADYKRIIAQRAYDLMRSGCIDINNAQMQQGGVTLHPNAMLRAVQDLTQRPDLPTPRPDAPTAPGQSSD
jgi:hypothetical protein